MSKPVSGLNVFQAQAGPIPLSQLDSNFTLDTNAINDLATYSNYFADSSGAPNVITVTVSAPLTFAYTTGIGLQVKLANTTTSATVNINVNALGNKTIINNDGSNPAIGSLLANSILTLMYDGTSFRLLHQTAASTGLFPNGSAASPSISFAGDPDTGAFENGANQLGLATAGTLRMNISTTEIVHRLVSQGPNGTAGAPTWSFENDPDTGIYDAGANNMAFAAGGVARLALSTSAFDVSGVQVQFGDGSAGTPQMSYLSDPDTGFYHDTANQIAIALGGVTAGQIAQGTFTGTFANLVGTPTGTFTWQRIGKHVFLTVPAVTANTNSTTQTVTGVPAVIQPATITAQNVVPTMAFEIASANTFSILTTASSGTLALYKNGSATGSSSGVSGYWNQQFTFVYTVA